MVGPSLFSSGDEGVGCPTDIYQIMRALFMFTPPVDQHALSKQLHACLGTAVILLIEVLESTAESTRSFLHLKRTKDYGQFDFVVAETPRLTQVLCACTTKAEVEVWERDCRSSYTSSDRSLR